jgi:hypothetical protein
VHPATTRICYYDHLFVYLLIRVLDLRYSVKGVDSAAEMYWNSAVKQAARDRLDGTIRVRDAQRLRSIVGAAIKAHTIGGQEAVAAWIMLHYGRRQASSSHGAAPEATSVSQNAPLTSLSLHVEGLWQIIRVISFTEALNTLRFGDPDTMYMPSVLAGYIQRCFHGQETQSADGRQMLEQVTYYDCLLFLLAIRNLDLRSRVSDWHPARWIHDLSAVSQAIKTLRPTARVLHRRKTMWDMCNLACDALALGRQEAAGALVLLWYGSWNRISEDRPDREIQYMPTVAGQFPSVPPQVIAAVSNHPRNHDFLLQYTDDSANRTTLYEVIHAMQVFWTEHLKRSLVEMSLDLDCFPQNKDLSNLLLLEKAQQNSKFTASFRSCIEKMDDLRRRLHEDLEARTNSVLNDSVDAKMPQHEDERVRDDAKVPSSPDDVKSPAMPKVYALGSREASAAPRTSRHGLQQQPQPQDELLLGKFGWSIAMMHPNVPH